jgi:uncharacterized membrane protein YccC
MSLLDRRAWLFSAKTFAAAMLAIYVSLRFGLPRPYWAMATCYIVAQPWSGMARAKGLYRILGTLGGVTAAIVLIPNLVSAPPLLALAMASWVALCLMASLLLHPPQNYAFMLACYTAAIVGFPSVDQPNAIFDTAVAARKKSALESSAYCASTVFSRYRPDTLFWRGWTRRWLTWRGSRMTS